MREKYTANMDGNEGYMTIFGCLLFLVILSMIFLCLDGIMIHQAESRSKEIAVGAGEHILANYNYLLAKRYHLYFLDSEMEDKIEARVQNYYETILTPSSNRFLHSHPFLNMKVKKIQTKSFGTMQEQKCLYLRHEIREYMKYDTTKDVLLDTIDQSAEQINRKNEQIRDMKEFLGQKEESVSQADAGQNTSSTLTPSEKKAKKEAEASAKKNDPRRLVQKIIKDGVLEFVTDNKEISEKYIPPIDLPSGSQQEKNLDFSSYSFQGIKEMKNLFKEVKLADVSEHSLACLYIKKHFNSYGKEEPLEAAVLDYEMEYMIGGRDSDKENLRDTVNRLILMRFAFNSIYAFKDPELNSQALTIATGLAGITGIPPLIEGIKYTVLGAVSFGEALLDVKNLMEGNQVPMIKTKNSWKLSVTGTAKGMEEGIGKNTSGLSYEEYLLLLLLMKPNKNKMYLRMQDLMQVNICEEQPGFQIEKCRFGFQMDSVIELGTRFGHGNYEFKNNRTFCY